MPQVICQIMFSHPLNPLPGKVPVIRLHPLHLMGRRHWRSRVHLIFGPLPLVEEQVGCVSATCAAAEEIWSGVEWKCNF